MAIETRPERPQAPGGGDPGARPAERAWWLRPNVLTALVGAVIGYSLGHWLGNFVGSQYQQVATSDDNDFAIVLGYAFGVLGWLIGLGVFNDLVRQMLGKPLIDQNGQNGQRANWQGVARYFRFTLDHKVVGLQYLIGMLIYFFTGGLLAIGIRTELLSPSYHVMSPTMYLEVVGEHGTMMMMMLTSVILGPFGNYLVPLMIGSKRVAFPRIEALSFWLTPCAYLILLSSFLDGGFPTGWTGYAPLSTQAGEGMDGYAVAFGLMGLSIILAGFNMIVTIICYRAPGMRWSRLPMFVWAMLTTGFLLVLAAPVLVGGMYMIVTDRTAQTAFFVNQLGGSSYLYEDLFWFFGHPEVYILALPGFGIVCEILPVFTRKPLFGYKVAAAGLFGVAILSFFVWQHHLFDSGMDPDMRPLFMLTTELISIPTGFIYLVAMGTFWKAKIRLTVPMLFAIALFFNFLFGGISGVFLSDVPADTTAHGSFFVMAHFHYTIMGGLIFAFFGGIYYWLPKVMGVTLNQTLGKIHFWTMFIAFNSTFMPLFAVGMLGQPRRVFEYAANLQTLNDWVSISAFCLGGSLCVFVFNLVMSTVIWRRRAPQDPWNARGLEWQVPSPPPADNFEHVPVVLAGPYEYGDPDALPVADLHPPAGVIGEESAFYHLAALNAAWTGSRLAIGALSFLFGAFAFAYFYLFSSNGHGMWLPSSTRIPSNHYGEAITGLIVVSALIQTAGLQLIKGGSKGAWFKTAIVSLVFGLVAVALQVVELLNLPFQPGQSGFASVFVGFYPLALVVWLSVMVWLEVLLARSRNIPAVSFVEQPPTYTRVQEVQRFQSALSAFTVVWNYVAIVTFLFWLLFYVR